ncbi:hypothetical protein [Streptomyces sp. NBC_01089]|uniref:hypothetical protein n=1 Tax=Streptomyces sp. NBC_01089 TaxID=2903747 RepID=UPI003865BC65|nr:hypothetical protein OG510_20515 [Streptomyces sp. NBC_01089]
MTSTADTAHTRRAWLVLGGLHLLNGSRALAKGDPLVLAELAEPLEEVFPSNTVVLRWADLGAVSLSAGRYGEGHTTAHGSVPADELFPGMLPGKALSALLDPPAVPLFYLSLSDGELHVHSQVRFLAEDACFIRTTAEPLRSDDPLTLDWLPEAVRLHAGNYLFLNNHQRYYQKLFPGKELEYKYTLEPPVDSWTLMVEMYRELLDGVLPGYIPEFRDEFQAWDYANHLFEITGPTEAERGYASFIPTTDGKHLLKRKWYVEDGFERRETHTYGLDLTDDGGFERHITEVLGVTGVRLPSFRRVRYDINFESVRTGHVYGIFYDHCSLVDDPGVTLNQCELEYLRSRVAVPAAEADVLEEMSAITTWLESFLRARGLNDEAGFYSKRTFLKDTVKLRPDLLRTVG